MGIRKLLVKNSKRRHGTVEQDEKQSENGDNSGREEDSVSALSRSWESDDSVSLSLESVDLDDESVMESVSTKTTVERNMRSRHETTDAKQEIEVMNAEDEEKNKVVKFLLSNSVAFDCTSAPLCQDPWW